MASNTFLRVLLSVWLSGSALAASTTVPPEDAVQKPVPDAPATSTSETKTGDQADAAPEKKRVDEQTLNKRFTRGFEAFKKQRYESAMFSLYRFVSEANEETINVEWGEYFLALSYQQIGLEQAAVDTFAHLLSRKPSPQIVESVLKTFEELSMTDSYDQELMIDFGIVNQDFGFITTELQDFIHYQQGLYNWRVGLVAWGDEDFSLIPDDSAYHYRVLLAKARRHVYHGEIDEALVIAEGILATDDLPQDLLADAELLAARLHFERRDFNEAIPLYANAVARGNGTSPILLELAWSHYLLGDREKALGLIYAFQAPSYRHLFTPELFVLKAHIYKDVCYYQAAERVSNAFAERYTTALDALYDRKDTLSEDFAEIHKPLLSRSGVRLNWNMLKRLQHEQPLIKRTWPKPLATHLKKMYQLKIDSTTWKLRQALSAHFDQLANQTLVISEEMNLIEYEMGVQRFQKTLESAALKEEAEMLEAQRKSYVEYPFQNEYWNDELGHFVIELESACVESAAWERQ